MALAKYRFPTANVCCYQILINSGFKTFKYILYNMSTPPSVAIDGGITSHEGVTTPLRSTSQRRKHQKTKPISHVSFPGWPTTERSVPNNENAHHDGNKHTGSKTFFCQMMFVWMMICIPANIFR